MEDDSGEMEFQDDLVDSPHLDPCIELVHSDGLHLRSGRYDNLRNFFLSRVFL